MRNWREEVNQHFAKNRTYTQRDFLQHFADEEAEKELKLWIRQNRHKPMSTFSGTADDFRALVAPALQAEIAQYGLVDELPQNLITGVSEDRDHAVARWVWKSEGIEDYLEGEEFKETFIEGATAVKRWRKPAAKIVTSYEAIADIPLDIVTMNLNLTLNEFRVREWKHFTHELHKGTSNKFDTASTDKNGNPLNINGWRHLFDNAVEPTDPSAEGTYASWDEIKVARAAMLRKERDAVMPNVVIMNASTEAELSDDSRVNLAQVFGGADTFFRTGQLPSIYRLEPVIIPDAHFGYFDNDVSRLNADFVLTNDVFLLTTNNGPTVIRYNREALSTETWRINARQQEAINLWERYNYGIFRYTNIMRLSKEHTNANGVDERLD